jgi:hypothetical protein
MSSIICKRSGVIEVSPYSNKPASPRRPRKDNLNSNAARIAAPYGGAVQSNVLYVALTKFSFQPPGPPNDAGEPYALKPFPMGRRHGQTRRGSSLIWGARFRGFPASAGSGLVR